MPTVNIFISSKMLELKAEREALDKLLPSLDYGDLKLNAWVFEEDQPAADSPIRKQYLKWLKESELYIGLFWKGYGPATIDEFDHAKHWGIERHIYVKHAPDSERDPQLRDFITQISDLNTGITSKWFHTPEELAGLVKARLDDWVREYRSGPGGEATARLYQTPAEILGRDEKLIGRVDLMAGAREHLQQNARLLLQGFSGTGKSRLAAELTAERTPALWLRAGRNDSDAIFEAIARPFNMAEAVAKEVDDEKVFVVRQMLARSNLKLLVLDDAWNGPALADVLQAIPPTLPLLMTSRKRLEVGPVIEVGNLPEAEARDLLRYHAGDYADQDGADDLCKLLGYLAFALRIAGKLLPKRKYTPADLYREIEAAPFDMQLDMSEKGRETVAKLIEISLRAVSDEARNVFLAFGAFFAPQLTPEMLNLYVAQNSDLQTSPESKAELTQLHDQGLIERMSAIENFNVAYFRLHDLAYRYAAIRNANEFRHRALDACLAYINRYDSPSMPNFAALRPELDGLLEAARWAFEQDRYHDGVLIADNLHSSGSKILHMQGLYIHTINLSCWLMQAACNRGNRRHEAIARASLGNTYYRIGRYEDAIAQHQERLNIARQINNREEEGAALGNLGNIYASLGQHEQAIIHHSQHLVIARQTGDIAGEGRALGNLGNAYSNLGQTDKAIINHQQHLIITSKIGDLAGKARALGNLGADYFRLGYYDDAINMQRLRLRIVRDIGDRLGEGNALYNMGSIFAHQEKYAEAIQHYEVARDIFAQLGVPQLASAEANLAQVRAKLAGGS
jgi:tetratricopeptide (TPR) repeat protein